MIISVIKNTIIYILGFYILHQITRVSTPKKVYRLFSIMLSLLLGFGTFFLKISAPELSYIVPTLIFTLLIDVFISASHLLFPFILICINFVTFEIFSLVLSVVIVPLSPNWSDAQMDLLIVLFSIMYSVFIIFIFKFTHIKNSLYNLTFNRFINIGTMLSLVSVLIYTTMQLVSSDHLKIYRICALITPPLLILLLYWWRSQITRTYREKLRILEMETLRATQREQEQYIAQLEADNQRMGRIIHKDNRIVTAMADSVAEFLQNAGGLTAPEDIAKGQALAEQILEIQKDRQALLTTKAPSPSAIPTTGQVGIDALIAYMAKEASLHHITLQFHFHPDFFQQDKLDIRENDIVHLLSDLLENAIIATRHAKGHNIELSMHKIKGTPTIAVSDSGIPFEANTYMNLGLQPASTHLGDGGSGIGLMDIWALKEKYKATLYIEELPEGKDFTKRLLLIFDRKSRYVVSSARWKELQKLQSRTDLLLMGPATQIETK